VIRDTNRYKGRAQHRERKAKRKARRARDRQRWRHQERRKKRRKKAAAPVVAYPGGATSVAGDYHINGRWMSMRGVRDPGITKELDAKHASRKKAANGFGTDIHLKVPKQSMDSVVSQVLQGQHGSVDAAMAARRAP